MSIDAEDGQVDGGTQQQYSLTIAGPGLTLERTIAEPVALEVLAVVMGGRALGTQPLPQMPLAGSPGMPMQTSGPSVPHQPTPSNHLPVTTIGEYLVQVGAKRNPDKITAIAAYLKEYRGIDRFSREDIKTEFPHAGETVPGNFPRDFNWAVSTKWIAADPSAGKDQYYVTGTGLTAVRSGFTGPKKPLASSRRRTSRRKASDEE